MPIENNISQEISIINNKPPAAGMEEVSPEFLVYEQKLMEQVNSDGVFQMELDERGFLRKLILRGTEVLYDAQAPSFSYGTIKIPHGQIMPLRPLAFTPEAGLLTVNAGQSAFFHYHTDSSRRDLELEIDAHVGEKSEQLLRKMMNNIAMAGGVAAIDYLYPKSGNLLEPQVQIELTDGRGNWRIVEGKEDWIISEWSSAAGMEEREVTEERESVIARELAVAALERVFASQAEYPSSEVLVFTNPETFDLVPLAVKWGRAVAVGHDGPEVDRLEKLLAQMRRRGPIGPYAVGTKAVERFLSGKEAIPVVSREDALRRLGLNPNELPPVVEEAIEITQEYLSVFV